MHLAATAAAAKSLQSCSTLCNLIDGRPPDSLRPWDSPGKNTGVGCHFFLQCMKVKSENEDAQSCLTLSMGLSRQEYWSWQLLADTILRMAGNVLESDRVQKIKISVMQECV